MSNFQQALRWIVDKLTPGGIQEFSDGYHTFAELYEFRMLYNAALFNEWSKQGKYDVKISERHDDGERCFGGDYFIVQATLPTGQISNHYERGDVAYFSSVRWTHRADEWDGHDSVEVIRRLRKLLFGRLI